MHIKEINGEKILYHCSYRRSVKCPDLKTTQERLKKASAALNIEKVSSGICKACMAIISDELDREELLNLKDSLTNNHG